MDYFNASYFVRLLFIRCIAQVNSSEHFLLKTLHRPLEAEEILVNRKFFIGIQRLSQEES